MRILFLIEHLYPAVGGAERSLHTLIRELGRRGHEVEWYCSWNEKDLASVQVSRFDWVVTQLGWTARAIELAAPFGVPVAAFVRSYEWLCRVATSNPRLHAECGQRCSQCPHRAKPGEHPFTRADLLLAPSAWMQGFLLREHGLSSEVVFPFIDPVEFKCADGPRHSLAMNQLSWAKGSDVFVELARRLPGRRFRLVGYEGWHPGIRLPGNVELTGPLRPSEVYAGVRLWLNPARWNEPFGRTNIEALLNRIPVLASRVGAVGADGLLEDGVTGHIFDSLDVDTWLEGIDSADRRYGEFVSAIAARNLDDYLVDATVPRFLELLSQRARVAA